MIYGRRASKPILGVGIDWANPRAWELQGFYACNDAMGSAIGDATGNIALSISGYPAGTSPWTSGITGANLNRAAAANPGQAIGTIPARLQVGWPISYAMAFTCLGAPTGGNSRPFWSHDGTSNTVYANWSIYWTSNMVPVAMIHLDYTSYVLGPALVAGQHYVIGVTVTDSEVSGYNGGSLYASYASAPPAPVYDTDPILGFDGYSDSSNIKVDWAAWSSRAWSAGDHAALAADPWQLFSPPAYRIFPRSAPAIASYPAMLLGMA